MNWMRRHVPPTERAMAFASEVLPTPGTSSTSRWPSANRHTSARWIARRLPRITVSIWRESASKTSLNELPSPLAVGAAKRVGALGCLGAQRVVRAGRGLHRSRPPSGATKQRRTDSPRDGPTVPTLPCRVCPRIATEFGPIQRNGAEPLIRSPRLARQCGSRARRVSRARRAPAALVGRGAASRCASPGRDGGGARRSCRSPTPTTSASGSRPRTARSSRPGRPTSSRTSSGARRARGSRCRLADAAGRLSAEEVGTAWPGRSCSTPASSRSASCRRGGRSCWC